MCLGDGYINTDVSGILKSLRRKRSAYSITKENNLCMAPNKCCKIRQKNCGFPGINDCIDFPSPTEKCKEVSSKSATLECGIRSVKSQKRDLYSFEKSRLYAKHAEFPWMLALMEKSDKPHFKGGASLIHPKVALTSADKVFKHENSPRSLFVRGGEWDTQATSEICDPIDNDVVKIIISQGTNLNQETFHIGIALLILKNNFKLNAIINIACLPPPDIKFNEHFCYKLGWGGDENETNSNILKKIEMPVIENADCNNIFVYRRINPKFNLTKGFMCAGGKENNRLCASDGGGPLNCKIDGQKDQFYQVGVILKDTECDKKTPSVFADLTFHREWIDNKLKNENLSIIQQDDKRSVLRREILADDFYEKFIQAKRSVSNK